MLPGRDPLYPLSVRVLAVDCGERRVGLAVSDESGRVVVPVGVVLRRSDAQAAREVAAAARERDAVRIVVGLPRRGDGSEGERAVRSRNFARRLGEASGLPVDLQDEGLTSVAADEALAESGARGDRTGARDAEAAATILRDWFSTRTLTEGEGP